MTSLQLALAIDQSYPPIIAIYSLYLSIKVVKRIFYGI